MLREWRNQMANVKISGVGAENTAPAGSSFIEGETSGGVSEHYKLSNLYKSLGSGTQNSTTFLRGDGTYNAPPPSITVQVVSTQTGAEAHTTGAIPADDTIPQNTEGAEFMTRSITPTSATNNLIISVTFFGASSAADVVIAALFQDSTAGALAAGFMYASVAGDILQITFTHTMAAGTTSATTFKVRGGTNGGSTLTFNGSGSARKLGGVLASSIIITEVSV
jgi:hypothetical protein